MGSVGDGRRRQICVAYNDLRKKQRAEKTGECVDEVLKRIRNDLRSVRGCRCEIGENDKLK
ncbi:hypothetical protein TSMEX_010720 [Taenia solium]|eukprot:TsM_000577900 transcript=TsM_000577900 gene=TsM_000577900